MGKALAFFALISVYGSSARAEPLPPLSPYQNALAELGYEPSGAGALRFLRSLPPSQKTRNDFENLIRELDADDFRQREAATKQLMAMPNLPTMLLQEAAAAASFEVRWRARHVLKQTRNNSSRTLFAALKLIQRDPPGDATGDVLAIIPYCLDPYVIEAAHEALRAAASKEDEPLLREQLGNPNEKTRVAAIVGLTHLFGADAVEQLHPLLDDPEDEVALAASRALAAAGDRRCLTSLLRLLDSPHARIRAECSMVLRMLTSESFGFGPYDAPEVRSAAVQRWKQWIATNGTTTNLNYVLTAQRSARGELHGNTLVSTGSKGKVMEIASDGTPVWTYDLAAWSAEKLLNGNVLIASYTAKKVVEVDSAGNVIWELLGPSAMTAKPLLNGNVLVADFAGQRVIEVDQNKHTVWEHPTPEHCFDADRLPNGNTIYGCPNRIREVTPGGDVVREWQIPGRLNGFQTLANGNVLVADYGQNKVYELNTSGEIVWEMAEQQPCDVFRLPDGRVLISTAKRIIEVGKDKRILRVLTDAHYGSARQ